MIYIVSIVVFTIGIYVGWNIHKSEIKIKEYERRIDNDIL